jgi:glycosyltransferase involved in cell wall biosynthesis
MHVAFYHDAVIPPLHYGGTERVVYCLIRGLLEKGNKVSLISAPGSFIPGVNHIPTHPGKDVPWVELIPPQADVVHLWNTPMDDELRAITHPIIITIGGNGKPGQVFHPNTVFVSKSHAEKHGSHHFVHNGILIDEFEFERTREDYLVFLAKASWKVKNLKGAIEIAKKSGRKLKVLGSRTLPFHLERILSRHQSVQYYGMVNDVEKRTLLKKAHALLFPVRWHEPFGLAVVESLASGCPVFATPYGSLPELIHPDCGFLSANPNEHVAVLGMKTFDPNACRKRAENFSHLKMTDKYLRYYEMLMENGSLESEPVTPPKSLYSASPEVLLPWN